MDHESSPRVIGIASGKGGVGKTTVTINLAAALAHKGFRVMVLDGDLGLANAQIGLGCQAPRNLAQVLRGERRLDEVIVTAPCGVRLVPGTSGVRDMAALDRTQVAAIIHSFSELDEPVDFLLVDIAAGISPSVLAFLGACQQRFVVVCDHPASIADAYALIKVMSTEEGMDEIHVLGNMAASQSQGRHLYSRLNRVCNRFLDRSVGYLTAIESDETIQDAWRTYQPVVEYAPASSSARDFRRLATIVSEMPAMARASGRVQFFVERMLQTAGGA
jgi:flagellar biosynthesis protein FlhG